jgi:hypothetical protein
MAKSKTRSAQAPIAAVASVAEFLAEIFKLPETPPRYDPVRPNSGLYTYRGLRNRAWTSRPSLFRDERLFDNECNIVREMEAVHPDEFLPDTTMFDRLVRMQHYHLPTRLLDVTGNPLVALFFATEEVDKRLEAHVDGKVIVYSVPRERVKFFDSEAVSCISNLCKLSATAKRLIAEAVDERKGSVADFNKLWFVQDLLEMVQAERPSFQGFIDSDILDYETYVIPKLGNRRILAQNGAFLLHGVDVRTTPFPSDLAITTQHIVIKKAAKGRIRRELNTLGINQATLFPEIDRAAETIVARYAEGARLRKVKR